VCTFTKRDGIISHVKLVGDSIFYVKNTKDLIKFDMKAKSSVLIGSTKDAVIALNVTKNYLRENDMREEEKKDHGATSQEIDEEAKADDPRFTLCCADEAENIYIFKSKDGRTSKSISTQLKPLSGLPEELREKDLFGMGYPYYCQVYSDKIAITTDYGVALLKYDVRKVL